MRVGGRKKGESAGAVQTPAPDASAGGVAVTEKGVEVGVQAEEVGGAGGGLGEEEDGNEREEEEEGEEEAEPVAVAEARPKLDDGYYEIEHIRKKRMRKGQLQYLIKWRGWPETANTWEPYDNLQSCVDMIEAFEERLRSPKTSRKRKRKNVGTQSVAKRKRNVNGRLVGATEPSPLLGEDDLGASDSLLDDGFGATGSLEDKADRTGAEYGKDDEMKRDVDNRTNGQQVNVQKNVDRCKKHPNSLELKFLSITEESGRASEEDGSMDILSKVESTPALQVGNRFSGAKKRKSGCVKRFKQDISSCDPDEAQNAAARSVNGSFGMAGKVGTDDDNNGDRTKLDDSTNPTTLIKILRPTEYSVSISNNLQDVSIFFVAQRSDGKEVTVNNKFLKENHPLMLISFYEQHLRYGPL